MAEAEPRDAEVEALFALVRQRYGSRLGPAELEEVREAVEAIVAGARALRAVRLESSDEPPQPFVPPRAEP